MQAHQARIVADFLLQTIESEIPATTAVCAAVPATSLDYRPDPLAKSALGLMRHLTLEDEWMLNAVADGKFAPVPDDSDACGIMNAEHAVACYPERIGRAIARVRALPDDALLREVDLFGMIKMPAVQFLSLMLRHSAHHRGQLSTYLRPMGAKVPSIYGPSADTQSVSP